MTARSLASLLAAALCLSTLSVARVARADDPKPAGPDGAPVPAKPADEPAPAPKASDEPAGPDAKTRAEVIRILDDLREEAAKLRGLAWKSKVVADLMTRPQLQRQLEAMIKDELDPKEYDRDLKVMRRLGMLTAEQDPLELTKTFLGAAIAGFYDPKTKKLYLIDGLTGDAQRPTILHELTHALEDQYIDLDKTQEEIKKDQDRTFAFKCAIEGSAETVRLIYEKDHPDYARLSQQEQLKEMKAGTLVKVLLETPAILFVPTLLNYSVGPAFVGRYVHGAGGAGSDVKKDYRVGIEKLYADFPTSEEQVMHPSKYVGEKRDLPRTVKWPSDLASAAGEEWQPTEDFAIGELDFAMWLDRWLGGNRGRIDAALMAGGRYYSDAAKKASEGWDGARLQLLEKKGDPRAYAFASAWDSAKDAVEAGEALLQVEKKQYGDRFKAGEWVEKGGVRTSNFEGPFGLGRIEVKADEVRLVDGLDLPALDRVFAALENARFEKSPADTWTSEGVTDPTAGADWRHEATGMGWKKPDAEWVIQGKGDDFTFVKGAAEVHVRIAPLPMEMLRGMAATALATKYVGIEADSVPSTSVTVAGKDSARLEFDSAVRGAADASAKRHVIAVLVPLGLKTLVVQLVVDSEKWPSVSKDFEGLQAGFLSND